MRKIILFAAGLMFFLVCAFSARAQVWTWEDAVTIPPPALLEIAADRTTGVLYGITDAGEVVIIDPATGAQTDLTSEADGANDIAIGPYGRVYICTDEKIQYHDGIGSFADLDPQPALPACDEGLVATGRFTHISMGQGGKLFARYELTCQQSSESPQVTEGSYQYLLVAEPPAITEGFGVRFTPRSLNLKSKGRWVKCEITPPEGMDAGDIPRTSIQITKISVSGVGEESLAEPIAVPDGAPWKVEDGKLKVRFIRYDRADPDNPNALVNAIGDFIQSQTSGHQLAKKGGKSKKFYQVTLTVTGGIGERTFEGEDSIRVKYTSDNGQQQ